MDTSTGVSTATTFSCGGTILVRVRVRVGVRVRVREVLKGVRAFLLSTP